jgi:hypothetical protein
MRSPTPDHAPPAPAPPGLKRCAGCDTYKPLRDFRQGNKPASELKTCAGCRARASERRRERKEEERGELRARALDLAQALLFLAERHPEYRAELNRLAGRVQRRGGRRTHDRDVAAVTAAMLKPLVQEASDIALEAQLPREDVERILSAMLAAGAVIRRLRPVAVPGLKVWLYSLAPSGPSTGDVLP